MKKAIVGLLLVLILAGAVFAVSSNAAIATLTLTGLDHPVAGGAQDLDLSVSSDGVKVYYVEWYDQTEARFMNANEKYKAGHVYRVIIWLQTVDNNEFRYKDNQTPDVDVKIFGVYASVGKAYEWAPFAMIEVCYTFPSCPTKKVSRVDVTVPEPVVGEKAVFDATLSSSDYQLLTAAPDLSTVYYNMVNGVRWQDLTAGIYLKPGDVFLAGHEYSVCVFVKPAPSMIFDEQRNMKLYINGVDQSGYYLQGITGHDLQAPWRTFSCYGSVGKVELNISYPVEGECPYFDGTFTGIRVKDLGNFIWYDVTDPNNSKSMGAFDKFQAGHTYQVTFRMYLENGYRINTLSNGDVDTSQIIIKGINKSVSEAWTWPDGTVQITHTYEPLHAHVPSVWMSSGTEHYKACMTCGKDIPGTREAHSGGKASCREKAKCTVCGVPYGDLSGHDFGTDWFGESEFTHVHLCRTPGCYASTGAAPHTPGPAPTQTTPQICLDCDYIIAPELNHQHSLTRVPSKEPTCTEEGNPEYYTCAGCSAFFRDAAGSGTFDSRNEVRIPAAGHKDGEYESDAVSHWKTCTSCGEVTEALQAHGDEDSDRSCDVCGAPMTIGETLPQENQGDNGPLPSTDGGSGDDSVSIGGGKGDSPALWWLGIVIPAGVLLIAGLLLLILLLKKKKSDRRETV